MKTMLAVLFFAFVGMSFAGPLTEADLTADDKQCIKDLGLEVQTVLDSMDDDFLTIEGDAKINEYSECAFRKLNLLDDNNEIKYDDAKPIFAPFAIYVNNKVVDKDQATSAAVDSCKSVKGESVGDLVVKFSNCVVKYIKEH